MLQPVLLEQKQWNSNLISIRTFWYFTLLDQFCFMSFFSPGYAMLFMSPCFCVCGFPHLECMAEEFLPKEHNHFCNSDSQRCCGYYTCMIITDLCSQRCDLGFHRLGRGGGGIRTWFFQVTETILLFLGLLQNQKSSLASVAKFALSPSSCYRVWHLLRFMEA